MRSLTENGKYRDGAERVGPGSGSRNGCEGPSPVPGGPDRKNPAKAGLGGYVFKESDWKMLRQRLPGWQERFMGRLVDGYAELLKEDIKASERFWELNERMGSDVRKVGVSAYMTRSRMVSNIVSLLQEGAITFSDLDGFSQELVEQLKNILRPL